MVKRIIQFGIVLLLLLFVIFGMKYIQVKKVHAPQKPKEASHVSPLQIKAAIPYWNQEKAVESFKNHASQINYISLFWYHLDENSKIVKYGAVNEDQSIINFAHAHNTKALAVITNLPDIEGSSWSSNRVRTIITNKTAREEHIQEILSLLIDKGFDGVNIDYEEVDEDLKGDFSVFIQELSDTLHKKGKIVGVALHPKSGPDLPKENNGSRAQNWQSLANSADQLYIMAYGEHWNESKAGPIASIPWDKNIINYAKDLEIPLKKVFLGMELDGMKWNKDKEVAGEGVSFSDIQKLLGTHNIVSSWDGTALSPYFRYEDNGDTYEVWYENGVSIKEKVGLAEKSGLGGVTFWYLGGEDPEIWKKIHGSL